MLKLQKNRNREINVTLRNRERFWTRTFIYALSIALGLHLFAVLIFQIHSYFHTDENIFPPIVVQADMFSESDNGILANVEDLDTQYNFLKAPIASSPQLPYLSIFPSSSEVEYVKEFNLNDNPFANLEADWEHLFSKNSLTPKTSIKVKVSGALAEFPVLDDGVSQVLPKMKLGGSHKISYAVQVEGKTGRIFWQMMTGQGEKHTVMVLAEQILANMRFDQNPFLFVQTGEIEINFVGA